MDRTDKPMSLTQKRYSALGTLIIMSCLIGAVVRLLGIA